MNSRSLIWLSVCLFLAGSTLFSQVSISIAGGTGSPSTNSLGWSYQFQCGGFYRVLNRVDLGVCAAYQTFSGVPSNYSFMIIPVEAEGRFYFSDGGVVPYFLVAIGIAHLEYNYDEVYKMPIEFGKYQTSSMKQFYNGNHMIYGLGAGVTVPVADAISADLGFRLTVVDSRLEMQRVFAPMSPIEAQPPSTWVFTQWSGGIRWRL
jgi:hypothetical protein